MTLEKLPGTLLSPPLPPPALTLLWLRCGEALIQGLTATRMTDSKQAEEGEKPGHSPGIVTICHTDYPAPLQGLTPVDRKGN